MPCRFAGSNSVYIHSNTPFWRVKFSLLAQSVERWPYEHRRMKGMPLVAGSIPARRTHFFGLFYACCSHFMHSTAFVFHTFLIYRLVLVVKEHFDFLSSLCTFPFYYPSQCNVGTEEKKGPCSSISCPCCCTCTSSGISS